ncbi:MAG: polyphenol oxidase family protein, partial [Spirochaetales bacterium]|nr:polyphenol oxidase family protein [Spirochaetales bacterium]
HTRRVLKAGPFSLRGRRGDGLFSSRPGEILTVTAADCLTVFLFHSASPLLALVHSGWRGTGIALEAAEALIRRGAREEDLTAFLGPCIGPCCYTGDSFRAGEWASLVLAALGAALRAAGKGPPEGSEPSLPPDPASVPGLIPRGGGRYALDLCAANKAILEARGLTRIAQAGVCTACGRFFAPPPEELVRAEGFSMAEPAVLGSYRREGPAAYTRMTAFFGWLS